MCLYSAWTKRVRFKLLIATQSGLPMKKGRAGTMTHDYKRNGTTTLFAALNRFSETNLPKSPKLNSNPVQ